MYFEARIHALREVESRMQVALLIKEQKVPWYEVLAWAGEKYTFLCVADGHVENPFLEVAILRQEEDGTYYLIESITAGWIETPEKLELELAEAERANPIRKAQLIIGAPHGYEIAMFTCGCCGKRFKGNVKEQLKYDQDAGYGKCEECIKYFSKK